jgi:hypothetical protein
MKGKGTSPRSSGPKPLHIYDDVCGGKILEAYGMKGEHGDLFTQNACFSQKILLMVAWIRTGFPKTGGRKEERTRRDGLQAPLIH